MVDFTSTEEETVAQTLSQVRLRVQNVTIAQDAGDAQLQHEAQAVDKHDAIYQTNDVNRSKGQRPTIIS